MVSITKRLFWTALIGVLSVLAIGCAARGTSGARVGESYPADPFRLELTVSPQEVEVGQSVTFEYALTNVTNRAVSACADAWDGYQMWGTRSEQGRTTVSLDRPREDHIFRVPPGAALVWKSVVSVRDIGSGEATVRGIFQSSCSSFWSGSVSSSPVKVVVKPRPDE